MRKLYEVESFINDLLVKNNCENVFVSSESTTVIVCKGNWFPMENLEHITYSFIENCIVIETELEWCVINLTSDYMELFDCEVD